MRVGLVAVLVVMHAAFSQAQSSATAPSIGPSTRPATLPAGPGESPTRSPEAPLRPAEAPAGSPKQALRSLNLALRDGQTQAIRSLFVTRDDAAAKLVAAMADYAAALVMLHDAAEKAYGKEGANVVTGDIAAQSAEGLAAIDRAEESIAGDTAVVKYASATDPPIRLVKIDDRWKLPLSQMLDGVDLAAERQRYTELKLQAELARKTAEEVNAGKYKEGALKAAEVWRSRLLEPITAATTRP